MPIKSDSKYGYILKERRYMLKRPIWHNVDGARCIKRHPSSKDMTALINYWVKKRAFNVHNHPISFRVYEQWEYRGYPKWFRIGVEQFFEFAHYILAEPWMYNIIHTEKGGYILERVPTLRERAQEIELDPECCKR